MSRLTREDALVARLMPAIRATRPTSQMRQHRAVTHAISDDGYILPEALLAGSALIIGDDVYAGTTSSSDTVNYVSYIETAISLPSGTWRVVLRGAVTGSLSGASNLNCITAINDETSGNSQIPIAAADRLATVFSRFQIDNVAGGELVDLAVKFRPSAGTATIENGFYEYRAERTA